jgi:hypothetical protein
VFCTLGLQLSEDLLGFGIKQMLVNIMTYVILHNMIIENERGLSLSYFYDNVGTRVKPKTNPGRTEVFVETHCQIEDASSHGQLVCDIKMDQWKLHGCRQT